MDVLEAIRTTRAMRRLDPDRPVSDEDLKVMIDAANRAPVGGGNERAFYVVVRDPDLKQRLGDIYRRACGPALAGYEKEAKTNERTAKMLRSAWHLACCSAPVCAHAWHDFGARGSR